MKVLDREIVLILWVPLQMISALHGTGVGHLLDQVQNIHKLALLRYRLRCSRGYCKILWRPILRPQSEGSLSKWLPVVARIRENCGARQSTQFATSELSPVFRKWFREALNLLGNPVKIELRDWDNPFAGRKNQLTQRQLDRRKRLSTASRNVK